MSHVKEKATFLMAASRLTVCLFVLRVITVELQGTIR